MAAELMLNRTALLPTQTQLVEVVVQVGLAVEAEADLVES
jgi:hypothetical protein